MHLLHCIDFRLGSGLMQESQCSSLYSMPYEFMGAQNRTQNVKNQMESPFAVFIKRNHFIRLKVVVEEEEK